MPMAPKVRGLDRDRHHVPHTRRNVAVASRTDVVLVGLIRLDEAGLDLAEALGVDQPKNIQMMSATNTNVAAPTYK